jgi:hypothetical protein
MYVLFVYACMCVCKYVFKYVYFNEWSSNMYVCMYVCVYVYECMSFCKTYFPQLRKCVYFKIAFVQVEPALLNIFQVLLYSAWGKVN